MTKYWLSDDWLNYILPLVTCSIGYWNNISSTFFNFMLGPSSFTLYTFSRQWLLRLVKVCKKFKDTVSILSKNSMRTYYARTCIHRWIWSIRKWCHLSLCAQQQYNNWRTILSIGLRVYTILERTLRRSSELRQHWTGHANCLQHHLIVWLDRRVVRGVCHQNHVLINHR